MTIIATMPHINWTHRFPAMLPCTSFALSRCLAAAISVAMALSSPNE
jgi:hypothetical protein